MLTLQKKDIPNHWVKMQYLAGNNFQIYKGLET